VDGAASARPRGTIVRSVWNCPGEPAPTGPLLISANPGCSLQIAFALAERGQDITVAPPRRSWTLDPRPPAVRLAE
jgi:hypothetical protein